jgi:2-C-methyl-D-erythritol 4-phosphate cytidylyltransferase
MDHFALIVAGGRGIRMGTEIPKQFLHLSGKPVLMHSILAFRKYEPGIPVIVVLPEDQIEFWQEQCRKHRFTESHDITSGGETRFHSVKNGLELIEGDGLVAIHDGVRPLIFPEVIARLFDEAAVNSSAIPAVTATNSLRWQDEKGNRIINRSFIKIIQTPQVFELNKLRKAYVHPYECSFTDDASVWEKAGYPVHLVQGQETNIKITNPEDLPMAQALMNTFNPDA